MEEGLVSHRRLYGSVAAQLKRGATVTELKERVGCAVEVGGRAWKASD
jgi:hypothetical protein